MAPEIVFKVERDEEGACFVASWDAPSGKGGITTQGEDLRELQEMILDATAAYFQTAGVPPPNHVRLHFVTDPELALA
jgi:predicted RNase H-like HicB family nuclease